MQTRTPAVSCSTVELAFLASLLGADSLIGIPDPFDNWPPDIVEAAWNEARQALAGRRIIALGDDGAVHVDEAVAALVGTCGFAEASFLVTYTPVDGDTAYHHFHIIGSSAVEVTLAEPAAPSCTLLEVEDAARVLNRVAALFRLGEQAGPVVPNGSLPGPALRRARTLIWEQGRPAAEAFLTQAGLHPETAAALALSLDRPKGNGALVAIPADRLAGEVDGLGLLEGENGLWLLRNVTRRGAQWVDVVPCSAEALRDFVRAIMSRALPGAAL